jgi:hypothetical protein
VTTTFCAGCDQLVETKCKYNHTLSGVLDLLHYLSVESVVTQSQSHWRPLRIPLFRNLLIADLVSDIGTFMQSVGAAWLMTSLTTSPVYIALMRSLLLSAYAG